MKRSSKLFFLFIFFFALKTNSQTVHYFELFFAHNDAQLSWESEHTLDSVLKRMNHLKKFYRFDLEGYSDSIGEKKHNLQLSLERTQSVANYFKKKGFAARQFSYSGRGNVFKRKDSDKDYTKNRRVICWVKLDLEAALPIQKTDSVRSFQFAGERLSMFTVDSGGFIIIPPYAFRNKTTDSVAGEMTLYYKEFRKHSDFMIAGKNPSSPELKYNLMNRGAFEIRVFMGDKECFLRDGHELSLVFKLNAKTPLLDLYKQTDSSEVWKFVRYLTNEKGEITNWRDFFLRCGFRNHVPCDVFGYCDLKHLLSTYGMQVANSSVSSTEILKNNIEITSNYLVPLNKKMHSIDSLQTIKRKELGQLLAYKKKNAHNYKIERRKKKKGKQRFRIKCDSEVYNEVKVLDGIEFSFTVKDNPDIPDSLYKALWDLCIIQNTGEKEFSFQVAENGMELRLNKANVSKKNARKKDLKKRLEEYGPLALHYKQWQDSLANIENESRKDLENLFEEYEKLRKEYLDYLKLVKQLAQDSLECLCERNKPLMTTAEKQLFKQDSGKVMDAIQKKKATEKWFEYFDSNKKSMLQRYGNLKKQENIDFKLCIEDAKNSNAQSLSTVLDTVLNKAKRDSAKHIFVPLQLKETGFYTCARKTEMGKQELLQPEFKDSSGRSPDISEIYLIDEKGTLFFKCSGKSYISPYNFCLYTFSYRIICRSALGAWFISSNNISKNNFSSPILIAPLTKEMLRNLSGG